MLVEYYQSRNLLDTLAVLVVTRCLHDLRVVLFEEAVNRALENAGDTLVRRKKVSSRKSVEGKHADYVCVVSGLLSVEMRQCLESY